MVKILHVWDLSGVACTIAKNQRKLGHDSDVIKRAGFDRFGIMDFYEQKTIKTWYGNKFLKIASKEAENYDVIHIHDLIRLVPIIRKKYPRKKIILQYHGSVLRNNSPEQRKDAEEKADKIFVSTPDLTKYVDGTYVPNPVDTDHFSHRSIPKNNKALSIMTKNETEEKLRHLLESHKISLKFEAISRQENPIKYQDMPNFLANYEYFVDLKYIQGEIVFAYSLIGLQALAVGLKVINHNFEIVEGLPQEHRPENVAKKILELYE